MIWGNLVQVLHYPAEDTLAQINEPSFPLIEHLSCARQPIGNKDETGTVSILIFPIRKPRLRKWRRSRGGGGEEGEEEGKEWGEEETCS